MASLTTDGPAGGTSFRVAWAAAASTLAGQDAAGDRYIVEPLDDAMLLAVIDGLGHGAEAAVAADAAAGVLRSEPRADPLDLVQRCHRELARTRGVVMSLAIVDAARARLTWVGVGNVAAFLYRASPAAHPRREALMTRSGVVGYQLPPLRAFVLPVAPGDTLVLATDGIASEFGPAVAIDAPPRELADGILAEFGKATDDALVLVARCESVR